MTLMWKNMSIKMSLFLGTVKI